MDSTYCLEGGKTLSSIEYFFQCHTKSLFESIIPAFYGVLSVLIIFTFLFIFRKRLGYTTIEDSDSDDTLSVDSQYSETDSLLGTSSSRGSLKLQLSKITLSLLQLGVFAVLFSIRWLEHTNGTKHTTTSILSPIAGFTAWLYAVVLCILGYFKVKIPGLSINTHLNGFYCVSAISTGLRIRLNLVEDNFSLHNAEHVLILLQFVNSVTLFFVSIGISEHIKRPSKPSTKEPIPSPEETASILSLTTFSWMNDLIYKGYRKSIQFEDIYDLQRQEKSGYMCKKFNEERLKFPNRSLAYQLIYFFRKQLWVQLAYSNFIILFTFTGPYFLKKILDYLEHPESHSREMAYLYVFGLLFGYIMLSIVSSQTLWIGRKIGNGLKAIIIGEVYSKSLRRQDVSSTAQESQEGDVADLGKITNLMAVDAHKISEISAYLNYLYALPMQIIVTVVFLYQVLGWSAIGGTVAIGFSLPLNYYLVSKWAEIQDKLMSATDKRMSVINEVLQGIRIIKFFAWEQRFKSRVDESRAKELVVLKERFRFWMYGGTLWFITPALVTVVTFYTYTNIANENLTASVAFASLALFKALQNPLDLLPDIASSIMQAKVSVDRVEKFLNEPESKKYEIQSTNAKAMDPTIGFKNATISWFESSSIKESSFSLKNINVIFPVGQLSIIAGPTGSGKSSMLMGLLGEMDLLEGSIYTPKRTSRRNSIGGYHTGIAYVAQQAWLQNDTIKNNILFGQPFEEARYNEVVEACALTRDLEILEAGDETEIGEKGIALSGGQKQRISLARAVYSRARHVLMDDCLSAVDAHTAKHLFQKCIMGKLMQGRTCVLVTHAVSLCMKGASLIVLLDQGAISAQGRPEDLLNRGLLEQELLLENEIVKSKGQEEVEIVKPIKPIKAMMNDDEELPTNGKLVSEETRVTGSVKLNIYGFYLRECGGLYYWIFLLGIVCFCQMLSVSQDYWIRVWVGAYGTTGSNSNLNNVITTSVRDVSSYWGMGGSRSGLPLYFNSSSFDNIAKMTTSAATEEVDTIYYVVIYLALVGSSISFIMIRYCVQFYGSLKASLFIHSKLMSNILHAPMRFFDVTPVGRIMNRFSKDIETVDQEVSTSAATLLIDLLATFTVLGVISVITPQFLYAVVAIILIYLAIATLYLNSSRELKRLESISRSPIYTQFGETLNGVSTIRAFGVEKKFLRENYSKIDTHLRPFIYLWAANRWLSVRIDIVGGFVAFFTGLFLLQGKVDPNLAGLSLNYALSFTDHVLWCVRFYSTNEVNMNSIERVQEYMTIEQEPPAVIEGERPPQGWPAKGEIMVNNLVMQYSPEQPAVIRDISFHVNPAEKVGIVGRTGAGKSTLAVAFFRFLEPISGSIIVDGVDIGKLGVQDLRSNLTIIPQDPVLFTGTIRSNLDPFNRCTDDELWMALKRVHLIESNGDESSKRNDLFDLDSPVSENGNNFSQGQRQLLALARALLKRSRLIILDEATASVDFETDTKIQTTIRNEFVESTLLCIAHRLRTIIDYDRIIVMDHGKLVEYDTPYNLIRNKESVFYSMCQKSGEFDVLYDTAKAKFGSVEDQM
ncbi:Transporter of the ATP-binding cassette (ABC) [Basidiobolus ranarum]|uniref:Transporter of the ATP-binding cassette (ABC) n=1 Tax=Basidiobolus ranarum TaxID=34480 RepID=A0ABR2W326_9FUNG